MPDPYYNPWAKVGQAMTGAVNQSLMSRPNPMEQELMRAKIASENARATNYNTNAQLDQAQLSAPQNIADIFGKIVAGSPQEIQGPVQPGSAPLGTQMMPPTPDVMQQRYQENLPAIMQNSMQYSANSPGNMGDVFAAIIANAGAAPNQIKNARMGADHSNIDQGYTLSPGAVRFDGDGKQIASAPFKPAGAAGSFSTTLPDGTVIEYGGATNSTMNTLQKDQLASAKFRGLLNTTRELALKNPNNFGLPGFVKGVAQDVNALAGGVAQSFGYNNMEQALADTRKEILTDPNIDPSLMSGIFDPDLPALQAASQLLIYQGAAALAGQEGRSVSDKDIQRFSIIFGNPESWLTNQQKYLSKLDLAEQLLGLNEKVTDTAAGGNITGPASGQNDDRAAKLKRLEELKRQKAQMQGG